MPPENVTSCHHINMLNHWAAVHKRPQACGPNICLQTHHLPVFCNILDFQCKPLMNPYNDIATVHSLRDYTTFD